MTNPLLLRSCCALPVLGAMLLSFSPSASGATVTITPGISPFTVQYDGRIDGTTVAGLTSTATFTFNGFSQLMGRTQANFGVVLSNTSQAPITDSRVSVFGFDVQGATVDVDRSVGGGIFTQKGSGNVPNPVGDLDICFRAGGNGGGCSGGGGGGVGIGESTNFTFQLDLSNFAVANQFALTNFGVRYQSVEGTRLGSSAVGVGSVGGGVSDVPEPSTLALVGGALAVVGCVRHRRMAR